MHRFQTVGVAKRSPKMAKHVARFICTHATIHSTETVSSRFKVRFNPSVFICHLKLCWMVDSSVAPEKILTE